MFNVNNEPFASDHANDYSSLRCGEQFDIAKCAAVIKLVVYSLCVITTNPNLCWPFVIV